MKSMRSLLLIGVMLLTPVAQAESWRMQPLSIPTRWSASVSPTNALPEYPRPQLVRDKWTNLNGLWDYAITEAKQQVPPQQYQGKILVPFPVESALSGVQKSLRPDQLLWYRREIELKKDVHQRTLLHFGAVDFEATVFVNGRRVGTHVGGYQSFSFDVTGVIQSGRNILSVKVLDPTMAGPNPHGKQGRQYTPSSGIWQTVWLEVVPDTYVEKLVVTPDVDKSSVLLDVMLAGRPEDHVVRAEVSDGNTVVTTQSISGLTSIYIEQPRLWSPDSPFLYDVSLLVLKNGKVVDRVRSYFGMRKVEIKKDAAGIARIFLNNRYTYNLGLLDQGFWPDGIHTAPTDAALMFDIRAAKAMGFNTIRKHIKIEPERWYYHCDRLGMLVWQDMVQPANDTAEAKRQFEKEVSENVAQLSNHPSIVTWVLFNENWGAYDQERLAAWLKALDPSRLLNGHSGPFDWAKVAKRFRQMRPGRLLEVMNDIKSLNEVIVSFTDTDLANWVSADMTDWHHYPDPKMPPAISGKARVVGESGGIAVYIDGHTWNGLRGSGQGEAEPNSIRDAYAAIVRQLVGFERSGLSASIYTQPYDVESEQNGLMTYDRAVTKIAVKDVARINRELIQPSDGGAPTSIYIASADPVSEAEQYSALVARYKEGDRERNFLRSLALIAQRQGDQSLATAAANEFIEKSSTPYNYETWAFIEAITSTTKDRGFEILRNQSAQANAILGADAAERRVTRIIHRVELQQYLKDNRQNAIWPEVEKTMVKKYDALGREAVNFAAMLFHADKGNWQAFGDCFANYYSVAASRSPLPIEPLAYRVFKHVDNPRALDTAIQAMKRTLKAERPGDSIAVDTYANLLYKIGRKEEALQWQETALRLGGDRDGEIANNLRRMKANEPTWTES